MEQATKVHHPEELCHRQARRRCAAQGPRAHRADPLWRSRGAVRPRAPAWRQKVQSVIAASSSPRRDRRAATLETTSRRGTRSEYENRSAQSSYSNPPPVVFPSLGYVCKASTPWICTCTPQDTLIETRNGEAKSPTPFIPSRRRRRRARATAAQAAQARAGADLRRRRDGCHRGA